MTPTHPLGQILCDHDRVGLRYERTLAHRPERVWQALTTSSDLRLWMPVDMVGDRRAGAPVELVFWPDVAERHHIETTTMPGEILVWEPPTVFEWRWDTDILRFELEPIDSGTQLVFTTWIGATPGIDLTAAGYHVCLDQLVDLIDTGTAAPFLDADPSEYERRYRELVEEAGLQSGTRLG